MCYSAMVEADRKKQERDLKATTDWDAFEDLFEARLSDAAIKIPKAVEAHFRDDPGGRITTLIEGFNRDQAKKFETDLFKQKTRLNKAQRVIASGETKKLLEEIRISINKIEQNTQKLTDLQRTKVLARDTRIFPRYYAPVIVQENGKRVIRPMRYLCRPAGKPVAIDNLNTLYNARRDNLDRFWKGQFGHTHGIMVVTSFFEHVALHDFENRELRPGEETKNLVLHFQPQTSEPMYVACLWSRWESPGEPTLESFAAITDDPPPEVAETGHDRCIVPIKPKHFDQWLAAEGSSAELHAILEDRARPYYEHQQAA